MLALLTWCTLIYLSGFLWTVSFAGNPRSVVTRTAAIPVGLVLYVLVFRSTDGLYSPWHVVGLEVLSAGSMLAVGRYIFKYNPSHVGVSLPTLSWPDYLVALIICVVIVGHSLCFIGHDEINHFFYASQISQGKFPPGAYGHPAIAVKYHYGWDILLASGFLVSGLSFPIVSDALTAYSLVGAVLLVLCILQYLRTPTWLRLISGVGFFLGDGVLGIMTYFVRGDYGSYLSLTALYHQHPWTFAVGFFLVTLLAVEYCTCASRIRDFLFMMLWLMVLYFSVPVCSGSVLPIVGVSLVLIAMRCRVSCMTFRGHIVGYLIVATVAVVLVIMWPHMGGIAVAGDAYDNPKLRLSLSLFGAWNYLKYMTAYLLMIPVGVIVLWYTFYGIFSMRVLTRSENSIQTMLWLSVLIFVPFPFILMVENAAYWDNFCKFNFLGVLAGWLMLPGVIHAYLQIRMSGVVKLLLRVAGVLLLSSCFVTGGLTAGSTLTRVVTCGLREWTTSGGEQFTQAVASRRHLIDCVDSLVDINSNIVIVDRRVTTMYPISRATNKSQVNLYGYIAEYYGEFVIVAQMTGRSIVNFYDYNFFYARNEEYSMADRLGQAFAGDANALHHLGASHLLCSDGNVPEYLAGWEKSGHVIPVSSDANEGWSLYRIPSRDASTSGVRQ